MPHKSLRILIADEHPSQRLQLEKMLNAMGYYRIAPVENFEDLQRLVQSALQPFNLLIGNIELASHAGVDLARFCRVSSQIQHALLYHSQRLKVPAVPQTERKAVSISLPKVPDSEALESFMAIIDLPMVVGQLPLPPGLSPGSGYPRLRRNFAQTVFNR
ncbi:response regulator [Pseudomonas shirazensis]|jgi:DNA-binding NtrC family response regulator|uniref:Histidine kinase n=3 Tax=Pseudomonas TaxID=286 RepID=A0A2S3WCE1_PSEPU|nr:MULTISPECIES: response regulator [Pseudomonas]AUF95723.1 histidine kinase [Pseudomonas sp. 02C 26]MBA1196652.1 response regulator [Pseudomonas plecoglossicida]MBO0366483.1 response regulator [Pseudomonas putida]MBV4499253.1 response regulator [Pseudomonas shirazensis]MCS4285569.1 DNA-binding NtrC family response regulator [Pseudomonas sp. BIGb0278]